MINKETIISVYNEKLTLLQWLKSVNKALDEAVLTNVEIEQRGNATFIFVFTFEDGTKVESNEIIVNQGESVNGASIRNGHLYLTLTNGDELDAGNVKPVSSFSINASQHLIVHYGDGTTQDLGAIFNGNISINGNITASGTIDGAKVTGNEIVEKMTGYSFTPDPETAQNVTFEQIYAGAVKNGNKLTIVHAFNITRTDTINSSFIVGRFTIPNDVAQKLYPVPIGVYNLLGVQKCFVSADGVLGGDITCQLIISTNYISLRFTGSANMNSILTQNTKFYARIEATFLLSDNLAS